MAALGLASALPTALSAQGTDARWLPWLGCWEPAGSPVDDTMVCYRPLEDEAAVEMLTVSGGEISGHETLWATGELRDVSHEGCTGTERLRFSSDASRVYTRGDYACEGGTRRAVTGIMSLVAPTQWLDVKSVTVDGEPVAWVQFYQVASTERTRAAGLEDIGAERAMAINSARMAASIRIGLSDVEEAAGEVDAKAVEAWVAERGQRFALEADDLVRMADAGIPESVIDVVVAVSFPNTFVVDDDTQVERLAREGDPDRVARHPFPYGRYYDPYYLDPFYARGFGYGYGFSPYGYLGYGYYGYSPRVLVVGRRDSSGGARVIKGRGYSRSGATSAGTQRAYPSGRSVRGSGSGSVSPRGSASGGTSKGSTPRKAKPRGGGHL